MGTCELDCAKAATDATAKAYADHAAGTITLEELKSALDKIWADYMACIENCLANP